jgi:hypothetical protein
VTRNDDDDDDDDDDNNNNNNNNNNNGKKTSFFPFRCLSEVFWTLDKCVSVLCLYLVTSARCAGVFAVCTGSNIITDMKSRRKTKASE